MSKLFISYRRSDTGYQPEIIKKTLSKYIDDDIIFYDHDIDEGEDFVQIINDRLESAQVMLVLIGKDWLNILKERSKLSGVKDFVKLEIERALEKDKLDAQFTIIPVLFEGAKMPTQEDLPESIKGLSRMNALTINQNEFLPKLNELGANICRKLNTPTYCFFKRFKYHLIACAALMVGIYFVYKYIENKPECEFFKSSSDLSILMVPDEHIDYKSLETIVLGGLDPYLPNVKSMKGKYYALSMGELIDVAKPCSPSIMIKGNSKSCCMATFDPVIENFIIENYSIHPSQFSKCNTSLEKLACVINTFLSEKNNNNNVFNNPSCIQHQFNEITSKVEIKDTLDMMIGQSMANMYEKQGNLDSAMIILEKLSTSGGLNPDSVYTRMSRIASKTKNTAVEIIAKTGLIKQAAKKGDENTKIKLQKDIKVLNEKLNTDQGKVILLTQKSNPSAPTTPTGTTKPPPSQSTHPSAVIVNTPHSRALIPKINATSNVKLYENLNRLINNGNYPEIERVYKKYKEKIDNDPAMLSLYYESMYKAKKISDSIIPAKLLYLNQRMKTTILTDKIKKGS